MKVRYVPISRTNWPELKNVAGTIDCLSDNQDCPLFIKWDNGDRTAPYFENMVPLDEEAKGIFVRLKLGVKPGEIKEVQPRKEKVT